MANQIRARLYSIVRTTFFRVFVSLILFWTILSILGFLRDKSSVIDTAFVFVEITQLYLTLLPIGVGSWYILFRSTSFQNNIPCQQHDSKSLFGSFAVAMIMNALFMLGLSICSVIAILCLGNRLTFSSASCLAETLAILCLISLSRTAWSCLCVELVRSRIIGILLALLSSCPILQFFLIDWEVEALNLFGIHSSSLPITSYTSYMIHDSLFMQNGKSVVFDHLDPHISMVVLTVFILLFSLGTLLIVPRRDVV